MNNNMNSNNNKTTTIAEVTARGGGGLKVGGRGGGGGLKEGGRGGKELKPWLPLPLDGNEFRHVCLATFTPGEHCEDVGLQQVMNILLSSIIYHLLEE
jgi:hypothetical protein